MEPLSLSQGEQHAVLNDSNKMGFTVFLFLTSSG